MVTNLNLHALSGQNQCHPCLVLFQLKAMSKYTGIRQRLQYMSLCQLVSSIQLISHYQHCVQYKVAMNKRHLRNAQLFIWKYVTIVQKKKKERCRKQVHEVDGLFHSSAFGFVPIQRLKTIPQMHKSIPIFHHQFFHTTCSIDPCVLSVTSHKGQQATLFPDHKHRNITSAKRMMPAYRRNDAARFGFGELSTPREQEQPAAAMERGGFEEQRLTQEMPNFYCGGRGWKWPPRVGSHSKEAFPQISSWMTGFGGFVERLWAEKTVDSRQPHVDRQRERRETGRRAGAPGRSR